MSNDQFISLPLLSLEKNPNEYLNYSILSSICLDFNYLKKLIYSKEFDKSFNIYSSMLNILSEKSSIDQSLENQIYQFLIESTYFSFDSFKNLKEIFEKETFKSLIQSYDSIIFNKSDFKTILKKPKQILDSFIIKNNENYFEENILDGNDYDYQSKLIEYQVDRLKIVQIEKHCHQPLGLTIYRLSNENENENANQRKPYRILIGRILHQSLAKDLFSKNDEILEINHRSIHSDFQTLTDIVRWIDLFDGILSFLILPESLNQKISENHFNQTLSNEQSNEKQWKHIRSLYSYNPNDDCYLPCRDLSIQFEKGQIFEIVDQTDPYWWQVYPLNLDQEEIQLNSNEKNSIIYPCLIPSIQFQEKRFQIVKYFLDEQINQNQSNKQISKSKNHLRKEILTKFKNGNDKRINRMIYLILFVLLNSYFIYQSVRWFVPKLNEKRPIVFLGAPFLGRHEFRERLMNCEEFSTKIDVAVPHTTRTQKLNEINGRDYHFVSRQQFEKDILSNYFVEYGQYQSNLYGTSKSSIRHCCQYLNKICILNLLPDGIQSLKYSNLFPYVIFFKVPSNVDDLSKDFHFNDQQWKLIQEQSIHIEENYSIYFDEIISLNSSFDSIYSKLKILIENIQNKSMWINEFWFSDSNSISKNILNN